MDEEDTFKKIKGLTPEEAEKLFQIVWTELYIELESTIGHNVAGGLPIMLLRERCDERLKPYGWSFDRLFPWNNLTLS